MQQNLCRGIGSYFRVSGQNREHYEKYYTDSPKSGKDYRLFVKKLDILRRK